MCGLFGYVSPTIDPARGRRALNTLAHRGPDQWNDWYDVRLYMGHRRLSILDLSDAGRQPMVSGDGRAVVTVNGEIYNFRALRSELRRHHEFVSESDSEVILHGYREWGLDGLLGRLEGMYAFAVYDVPAGRLHLARDRVGIKPLYYALEGSSFAWASELKAIRQLVGADALRTDQTALYDFLTYKYVPAPKTLYRNVFKLPPANVLSVDVRELTASVRRYWSLPTEVVPALPGEAARKLRHLVADAVGEQMVSDVPLGFLLSGGLDSSAVVAEASRAGAAPQTFSVGFEDPEHDESEYARMVADAFSTRHHTLRMGVNDVLELFPRLLEWYDEPFADTSAFPTYRLCALAREHATVVLSGDGGDELFGGYRWYRDFARLSRRWRQPFQHLLPLTRALKGGRRGRMRTLGTVLETRVVLQRFDLYARLLGGLHRDEKRRYRSGWGIPDDYDDYWFLRQHYREDLPLRTRLQYLDFHTYLPEDVLTKVDRASMAVSLEVRVPLLSTALVEFAFSLPEEVRYLGDTGKGLFKTAYASVLPPAILARAKRGFSIPLHAWAGPLLGDARSKEERILADLFAAPAGGRS